MCVMLPELQNCCGCWTLRTGCVFIGILSIMTGSSGLSGLHQQAKWDFDKMNHTIVTGIFMRSPLKWIPEFVKRSHMIAPLCIAITSINFMFMGILVFYSALFDREDAIQIGVWGLLFNSVLGLLCVLGVSLQCFFDTKCLFDNMDWFSQCILIGMATGYLILWMYFVTVINSYVETKYD